MLKVSKKNFVRLLYQNKKDWKAQTVIDIGTGKIFYELQCTNRPVYTHSKDLKFLSNI